MNLHEIQQSCYRRKIEYISRIMLYRLQVHRMHGFSDDDELMTDLAGAITDFVFKRLRQSDAQPPTTVETWDQLLFDPEKGEVRLACIAYISALVGINDLTLAYAA